MIHPPLNKPWPSCWPPLRFVVWVLDDEREGTIRFAADDGRGAIRQLAALYPRLCAVRGDGVEV